MEPWKNPKTSTSLIDFPPLYSVQAKENQIEQFNIWADLLVAYTMKTKVWSISIQECPMFVNKKINREASMELRKQIVDYMISKGVLFISFNNNVDRALWIGSSQHSQAYIMPKSFTEWGDIVYSCLVDSGTTDPVQSHELIDEPEYTDKPFFGMPEELMEHILKQLTKQGKLVTFKVGEDNNYKLNPERTLFVC